MQIVSFPRKIGYDTSCKLSPLETICMKCQIPFSRKSKKNITNLSSAESAHSMVSDNWNGSHDITQCAITGWLYKRLNSAKI